MSASNDMMTMGIRLSTEQRKGLDLIAARHYNTPSALVRLAIDNLLASAKANGGQLPPAVEAAKEASEHPEAAALAGALK